MSQKPPDPSVKLDEILPDELKKDDPVKGIKWQTKYGQLTRGDLMRLAGWMPMKNPTPTRKNDPYSPPEDPTPVPGLGEWPKGKGTILSGKLENLDAQDFLNLRDILRHYNSMGYGTSLYFCCTCG